MCGIIFHYDDAIGSDERLARARRALGSIAHRGPDDEGLWEEADALAGHRRLSIIDLGGSRQPMASPDGRYVLVYNGELYNYRSLRAGLARHWTFTTEGDTEVLLAGLVHEGERFLQRMDGMWALALWDTREHSLLLARDRMGKKPLYYSLRGRSLGCASELGALAHLLPHRWQEDLDTTADYLRYGFTLPGHTFYEDVHEVLPAHVARWSPGREVTSRAYWTLEPRAFTGTRSQARSEIRARLIAAVERRLVADVEVGAFLSGGIDSSLIVGILAEVLQRPAKTFTIGFEEASFDERDHARTVARRYGTGHFEETVSIDNRALLTDLVLRHVGQPFFDSSLLPTAAVSRLASRHLKVALSGDGGDEVFSGYQRYMARTILRWYTRLPRSMRALGERALSSLPEPAAHHSRSLLKKAHLFLDIVRRREEERPYVAPVLHDREGFRRLAPALQGRGHRPPCLPRTSRPDEIQEMMLGDALVYLPQDILVKVDRASMASALETRAPFLDRELMELAFSLPPQWHRRGLRGKRMLREAFGDLLPASVWRRRKQGFAVPVHAWFRGEMGEELQALLGTTGAPVAPEAASSLLRAHRAGRRDHGYRLWSLYVYLLWRSRGACPAS